MTGSQWSVSRSHKHFQKKWNLTLFLDYVTYHSFFELMLHWLLNCIMYMYCISWGAVGRPGACPGKKLVEMWANCMTPIIMAWRSYLLLYRRIRNRTWSGLLLMVPGTWSYHWRWYNVALKIHYKIIWWHHNITAVNSKIKPLLTINKYPYWISIFKIRP